MEGDDDAAAAHPSGGRRPPSPRCCVLANRRQLTRQPPSSANRPVHGGCKLRKIVHTRRLQIPHYKRKKVGRKRYQGERSPEYSAVLSFFCQSSILFTHQVDKLKVLPTSIANSSSKAEKCILDHSRFECDLRSGREAQKDYIQSGQQQGRKHDRDVVASSATMTPEQTQPSRGQAEVHITPEQSAARCAGQNARNGTLTQEQIQSRCDRHNARYAALTPEQRLARRERDRARRQSLTTEQRQEINARRRARRQSLTAEERGEINTRRRAARQSITPAERQALLNERNASYTARRDTLCAESIAIQCPASGASTVVNPSSNSHSSATDSSSTSLAVATADPPTQSFIMDDENVPQWIRSRKPTRG